jgi:hypothetical protein
LDSLSGATPSIVTSMRSVRGDVERIAAVLGTVDSVLGNIGRLPGVPNYAPDQPLASTVLGLRPELDALIDGLVAVDTAVQQIDRDAGPLTARLATLRADLGALRTDVADAERLLAEYQGSTLEAQVLARRTRSGLARDLTETRVLVVLAGVVFLVGQVVPLTLRRLLLDAGPPVDPPVDSPAPDRSADSPAEAPAQG